MFFASIIKQDVVSLEKIYDDMLASITYKQSFRRVFALLSGLVSRCFVGIAVYAVGMFYSKRMLSRVSSCPRGIPLLVKANANTRLALLGRYDCDERTLHA